MVKKMIEKTCILKLNVLALFTAETAGFRHFLSLPVSVDKSMLGDCDNDKQGSYVARK